MIYLNNAATTWPKPEAVYQAVDSSFRHLSSPMRGTSAQAARSTATLDDSRGAVAAFLGIADAERLIFLPSCTYALNLAILGQDWEPGDRIVMSGLEHHAISRPVRKVADSCDVEFRVMPYRVGTPIDLNFLEDTLRAGRVRFVACTMASNVTGEFLPYREVVRLCRMHGARCLLDGAQVAGIESINIGELQPDYLSVAGHKGLYGPPGIGGLYVAPGYRLRTLAEGGTGKDSGLHEMSGSFPSNYEVGTHNHVAIAGLLAGVQWLAETGIETVRRHEQELTERFLNRVRSMDGVRVFGDPDPAHRTAVVSLTFDGITPQLLAKELAERDITTRAGYHCAPLAHETIGSLPGPGTIRFSFGYFNTSAEVDQAANAIEEIRSGAARRPAAAPSNV